MQVVVVRCPRCLLTIYTLILNAAPGTPKIFMVAPLADQDLLFYNCPMDACEFHIPTQNPTNLYRNSTIGFPMNKTPGLIIEPRTSDTVPFRTAEQVAALAINVDLDNPVAEGVDIPTTTTTTTATPTKAAAATTEPKSEPKPEPARPPPVMPTWRPNAVPRSTTERPTPERPPPAKRRAIERPAGEQSSAATTAARFVVAPQTPQQRSSGSGYQAGRNGASVPPVADIPRPTLAQPSSVGKPAGIETPSIAKPFTAKPAIEKAITEKAITEQPIAEKVIAEEPPPEQPTIQTPAAEKPTTKKPATEQPKIEAPAKERSPPQVDGHEAAKQNGTGSPAAAETPQQQQQATGLVFKGKWTDAEVDRLKELNGQNLRQAAIATEMNRTTSSIKAKLADVRQKTEKQARAAAAGQETEPDSSGQIQTQA